MERFRSARALASAGFALFALACGSSSSSGVTQRACNTDLDCKNGESCKAKICQAQTKCTSSNDCLNGQYCNGSGVCASLDGAGGSTGGGGESGSGGAVTGAGGLIVGTGGTCVNDNVTCAANSDCCGYRATPQTAHCVNFTGSSGPVCAPLCTTGGECPTGCCVALTTNGVANGLHACGPASDCASTGGSGGAPPGSGGTGGCVGDLGSCSTNGDCCGYPDKNRCWDPNLGTGAVCAIVCTANTDCVSNCCLLLNSGYSVCAPASDCP